MNYQWYPGHMTKARRMMQEDIKLVDLVIELVDARIPLSSRNPDIDELGKNKSRIVLLNKSDLADPIVNKAWVKYFQEKGEKTDCCAISKRTAKLYERRSLIPSGGGVYYFPGSRQLFQYPNKRHRL